MNSNKILVSIIIANRNGEKFLADCINSIYKEQSDAFEVVVVDDDSEDKSLQVLAQFKTKPRFKVISQKKRGGAGHARNTGTRASRGKYIFFLDLDTILVPGWVKKTEQFFKTNQKAGMAQVKILRKGSNNYDYAGDYVSSLGFIIDRSRTDEDTGQFDKIEPIFSGKTAGALMRRDIFDEIGGFDIDYLFYIEDTDIMWRTWLAGYQVLFYPEITVYHAYGTKEKGPEYYVKSKVNVQALGCRNTLIAHAKNWGLARMLFVVPVQLAAWTILGTAFLLHGNTHKGLSVFQGIGQFFKEIPRIIQKRKLIHSTRRISDSELMKQVGVERGLDFYFGKAKSYILGKPF